MGRILLKLSGEALADSNRHYDDAVILGIAKQVKQILNDGNQVGIVIGGGNYWRGRTSENIDRTKADQIGMLATIMNCIYVSELFRSTGIDTRIMTPFACSTFTELFSKDKAVRNMEKGRVVEEGDVYSIFAEPNQEITKKFIASQSSLAKISNLVNDPRVNNPAEGGRLIKLTFLKNSVGESLISLVSQKFNVRLNIVLANVDMIQDSPLGEIIVVIKGEEKNIEAALAHFVEQKVKVTEVEAN